MDVFHLIGFKIKHRFWKHLFLLVLLKLTRHVSSLAEVVSFLQTWKPKLSTPNRRCVFFGSCLSLCFLINLRLTRVHLQSQGCVPLFVNATAGSTVYGAFDPINEIADICEKYNLWLHVDVSALQCARHPSVAALWLAMLATIDRCSLRRERGAADS